MAIHPDYRRRKLGKFLMNESLQTLKEMGLQKVSLHVTNSNYPARLLYESLGFKKMQSIYIFTNKLENIN